MPAFRSFSLGRSLYLSLCLHPFSSLCFHLHTSLHSLCVSVLSVPCPPLLSPLSLLCPSPLSPVISHQSQPIVMEERPCQEYYLPVRTKGVFFVLLPVIHLQRDRSPNIHLRNGSRFPTLPGPLALLYYGNNSAVGGNHRGREEMLTAPRPS